jgi:F-type H+-transporting ATPase subunit b
MRLITFVSASNLVATLPVWAEESDKGGLPQLNTSLFPEQLFWLAISFAVLYVLMATIALPRVAKTQSNRKLVITTEIEAARLANNSAKLTASAVDKSLNDARAKAQASVAEMLADVTQDAANRKAAQERDLLRHLHSAEADIAVTREAALQKIQASASELAAVAVEKIVGFKLRGGI